MPWCRKRSRNCGSRALAGARTSSPADAARRASLVLHNDPATGVMRHADAGYPSAVEAARAGGVQLPWLTS